mmetsp:Transcript_22783/g.52505  ORF Transcript_22783/g.52505 Transcript_22783/m.52505 type:complete len:80 (+) Transcript_22783:475-714(+)
MYYSVSHYVSQLRCGAGTHWPPPWQRQAVTLAPPTETNRRLDVERKIQSVESVLVQQCRAQAAAARRRVGVERQRELEW